MSSFDEFFKVPFSLVVDAAVHKLIEHDTRMNQLEWIKEGHIRNSHMLSLHYEVMIIVEAKVLDCINKIFWTYTISTVRAFMNINYMLNNTSIL